MMRTTIPILAILLVASSAMLGGCATMSPEECMVADWHRIGEQDARAGRSMDYLAQRAGDCNEAGYPADVDAWHAGFEHGLGYFCTIDSGFRFGLEGQRYLNSCPTGLELDFIEGYELGHGIHQLSSRVDSSRRELERLNRQLRDLQREERPDREEIADLLEQRDRVSDRLRAEEVELATLRGVAQGRGFRLR
jgi:hypothetical protein